MKYSLVHISNQRYQAIEFVDRPVPEKFDSFRIHLSCVFFTKHTWHFEYVVGYITIPDPFFSVSTEKNACIFICLLSKMETIISRPAFGRASTNQKKKKKETKRKLGFVRLIKRLCNIRIAVFPF